MFQERMALDPFQTKSSSPHYFALLQEDIKWEKCRERFALQFTGETNSFLYCHEVNPDNIASFIYKTEEIIGVNHCTYNKTNSDYIININPTNFWKECYVRRSFFTALVRASEKYNGNNYEESIFSNDFFRQTKRATMRFLFGFTKYIGRMPNVNNESTLLREGWVEMFKSVDDEYLRTYFISDHAKPSPLGIPSKFDVVAPLWT